MAVPDVEILAYQRLRLLLENDPVWPTKFDVGNRIWYNDVEGTQNPEKSNTADGDYPQSRLWLTGGSLTAFAPDQNFGTHSPEGCPDWQEQSTLVFTLELKSQTLKFGQLTNLGTESRAALRAGGPRLGLDFATGWALSWEMKEIDRNSQDETFRWEVRIRIQIALEYEGSGHVNPPEE